MGQPPHLLRFAGLRAALEAGRARAVVTHVVGQALREADPAGGRKFSAILTGKADRVLRGARLTHSAVLRRTCLAAATPADRKSLQQLWQRLSVAQPGAAGS